MKTLNLIAAAALMALGVGAAGAATYNATQVVSVNPGTGRINDASRYQPTSALGAADRKFYSLGMGGDITLGFGTSFSGGKAQVWEVTYSTDGTKPPADRHFEAVNVYAVVGKTETLLGRILNYGANTLTISGAFQYIKLVDATRAEFGKKTTSVDGFDVDSVSIAAVPLPAAGLMLLAGLGGLAALRRRKRAA